MSQQTPSGLHVTGKCLGTKRETVNGPNGSFVSVEFALQIGEGFETRAERVRPARDFPEADMPKDGETVTLAVVVSAYAGRNGAGYRLTALNRVHAAAPAGLRSASA